MHTPDKEGLILSKDSNRTLLQTISISMKRPFHLLTLSLPTLTTIALILLLPFHCRAQSAPATISTDPTRKLCSNPTGFTNTLVRAATGNSPTLGIKLSFLSSHILFSYTDTNTAIAEADFARFCLSQCIGWQGGASNVTGLKGGKGGCKSFTVDMGKPLPGTGFPTTDTAVRWWCEGFDEYLAEDLSDYERPNVTSGSYMYGIGVNRGCGDGLRFF